MFDTDSTIRETTPGCLPPRLERAPAGFLVEVVFLVGVDDRDELRGDLAADVVRDELRGDLAADVLAVLDDVVLEPVERPDVEVERDDFALPLLPRPIADVFDRADVVLRDEDDLEPPLFEDPPRDDELLLLEPPPLLLLRDEEPPLDERAEPLRLLLDEALPPLRPAALF